MIWERIRVDNIGARALNFPTQPSMKVVGEQKEQQELI